MTLRSWKFALSLIIAVVMMVFLYRLEMFEEFIEIDSTSVLCQLARISVGREIIIFDFRKIEANRNSKRKPKKEEGKKCLRIVLECLRVWNTLKTIF